MTLDVASLEQIAKQKATEESATIKPVFLSKEDRQALAMARLEEKRAAQREKSTLDIEEAARAARKREREFQRELDVKRAEERVQARADREQEKIVQMIKDQKLGKKQEKKAVIPPSMKHKFNFDWEPADDTSNVYNPIGKSFQPALAFGRGFMAGVDRRLQRKQNQFYEDLVKNRDVDLTSLRDQDKARAREEREAKKSRDQEKQNRHWKEKTLEEMEERDWRIFKEDFNITTRGTKVPQPLRSWSEGKLPDELLRTILKVGWTEPFPIQRAAIPVGLANIDVVGIAQTGSGKTGAFLIPMAVYLHKMPRVTGRLAAEGPYAMIMAPTRELADQIAKEAEKLASVLGLRSALVVGGQSIEDQGFELREGVDFVIGTPGRLRDCLKKHYLVLNQCNYIVLDEADRMIDMNYEDDINALMDAMASSNIRPEEDTSEGDVGRYRQTVMFSATMPLRVELLAKRFLRHPVFIAIGERQGQANLNVEQRIEMMTQPMKRKRLMEVLNAEQGPFIVFVNAKKECDALSKFLETMNWEHTVIHGSKSQDLRDANLKLFKEGKVSTLIATDVVGRGIDIAGVEHVINYDMPAVIDKYTHRIGRTGRAGRKGIATSFVTMEDSAIFAPLKELLLGSGTPVPPELAKAERESEREKGKGGGRPAPTLQRKGQTIFAGGTD